MNKISFVILVFLKLFLSHSINIQRVTWLNGPWVKSAFAAINSIILVYGLFKEKFFTTCREIVRRRTISRQVILLYYYYTYSNKLLAEYHETKRVNECCIMYIDKIKTRGRFLMTDDVISGRQPCDHMMLAMTLVYAWLVVFWDTQAFLGAAPSHWTLEAQANICYSNSASFIVYNP